MKKKLVLLAMAVLMIGTLTGCDQRQADDVSYNLSLEADNFNDVRQITVINGTIEDAKDMTGGILKANDEYTDWLENMLIMLSKSYTDLRKTLTSDVLQSVTPLQYDEMLVLINCLSEHAYQIPEDIEKSTTNRFIDRLIENQNSKRNNDLEV